MPTYRQRFLRLQSQQDRALTEALTALADRIRRLLVGGADATGAIPPTRFRALEDQVAALVFAYFLSVRDGSTPTAFTVGFDGSTLPQSAYMRLLWSSIQQAARLAVEQQAAFLRQSLRSAPDVTRAWSQAQLSPFFYLELLPEAAQNAFQTYQPPQRRELGGRVLADRVLYVGANAQRGARLLTRALLAEGKPAREVADTIQRWLTGTLERRNQPYGTTGRFEADRLLHGEITSTYGNLGVLASTLNPFIDSIDWLLSPLHTETDECDANAAGSPYTADTLPTYPSHGNCLCSLRFNQHQRTKATVERLRGSAVLQVKGALAVGFADLLLKGQT